MRGPFPRGVVEGNDVHVCPGVCPLVWCSGHGPGLLGQAEWDGRESVTSIGEPEKFGSSLRQLSIRCLTSYLRVERKDLPAGKILDYLASGLESLEHRA